MATEAAARKPDVIRAAVAPLAVGIVVLAQVSDPAGWGELALLVVAAGVLICWVRWSRLPTLVLTVGVLVPVILAQRTGELEPAMFLVSLLALAVAGWEDSTPVAVAAGLAAVASPILIVALQPPANMNWSIWMVGIAFPWVMGWLIHRQERLSDALDAARTELADRAVAEERRNIARDVHDLVSHGLAAMLLQVTSARHVLRRDADEADEALASAEAVGRRSMQELRRTVALLRSDGDGAIAAPLPGPAEVAELVDLARAGGLDVRYSTTGDHELAEGATGLALYRIAQEALANAARHAPRAHTVVRSVIGDGMAVLEVESAGPLATATTSDPDRTRYGLVGMRERAEAVGGELQAGPTELGWRVRARIPLDDPPGTTP